MNDAELVKSRLDIVEVIAGYVELKKAGKDYRGLSPFRQEKTPSFFVSPEKQIWHDFGSSEGGDIISFVMRMEGLSFPETLEMLADRAGVKLSKRPTGSHDNKTRLFAAVDLAVRFYHYQLSKAPKALTYVRDKRALASATIKEFKIGYAPDDWSAFTNYALGKDFTLEELTKAGLSGKRQQGNGGYDVFRDRIMFPIYDMQGRAVGFSGRLLEDKERTAKYINTPDTPIYHKSRAIFGLRQAKNAIRESGSVVLVEGNIDVATLWQHGQQNTVAVSGTAFTAEQLTILSRLADRLLLCFDQDEAGVKATQRAIELSQSASTRLEVITYEGAKDPDELIRQGTEHWTKALNQAQYAVDYLFDYAVKKFGTRSAPAKKQLTQFLLPTIRNLSDRIELEHYVTRLAQLVDVEPAIIRQAGERQSKITRSTEKNTSSVQKLATTPVAKPSRQIQLEEMLLEFVLANESFRAALSDLDLPEISDENRGLFEVLVKQPDSTLAELTKILPPQAERVKILALRGDHEYSHLSEHEKGLEAFTQVHNLQKHILRLKKSRLTREIRQAETAGDTRLAAQKLQAYQALATASKDL